MVNIPKCQKNWWAPVWKGLVIDPDGKHCRAMKNALWLFLYFLLNADRKKGFLLRKVKTITSDMGVKRDTVLRWFKTLRNEGYVSTRNTGRCLLIQIEKWKPLSEVGNFQHQIFEVSNIRSWKNPTSGEVRNHLHFDSKTRALNDITIKKNILTNDIDKDSYPYSNSKAYKAKVFRPKDDKDRLALDIAKSLNDMKGLSLYLSYSRKYPQSLLVEVFEKVKEMPDQKIKKSRGALFNHLIQRYAKKEFHNFSD